MLLTFSVGDTTEITSIWATDSKEVATHTSATHCPHELAAAKLDDLEGLTTGEEADNTGTLGKLSRMGGASVTLATAQQSI